MHFSSTFKELLNIHLSRVPSKKWTYPISGVAHDTIMNFHEFSPPEFSKVMQ